MRKSLDERVFEPGWDCACYGKNLLTGFINNQPSELLLAPRFGRSRGPLFVGHLFGKGDLFRRTSNHEDMT
jgi:hypothetical protein